MSVDRVGVDRIEVDRIHADRIRADRTPVGRMRRGYPSVVPGGVAERVQVDCDMSIRLRAVANGDQSNTSGQDD